MSSCQFPMGSYCKVHHWSNLCTNCWNCCIVASTRSHSIWDCIAMDRTSYCTLGRRKMSKSRRKFHEESDGSSIEDGIHAIWGLWSTLSMGVETPSPGAFSLLRKWFCFLAVFVPGFRLKLYKNCFCNFPCGRPRLINWIETLQMRYVFEQNLSQV